MRLIYCLLAAVLFANMTYAQAVSVTQEKNKHKKALVIGSSEGITVQEDSNVIFGDDKSEKTDDKFHVHWVMFDLGFNSLQDHTDYNSQAAKDFLHVPEDLKNSNLFSLNQSKSVNVNIYPIMTKYRLLKTKNQRIYLVSGIGLQLYNFRFDNPVSYKSASIYANSNQPYVTLDTLHFSKNKLAFDYLQIPLELVFKTRLGTKNWFVYGFGITGGYRLSSWTKQVSSEEGKQKDHSKFNFADFNSCLMGEIGLDGYFRLYATYQITSLQENALDQHPFCIGIRFMGI